MEQKEIQNKLYLYTNLKDLPFFTVIDIDLWWTLWTIKVQRDDQTPFHPSLLRGKPVGT